jgi:hypothetical protein
MMWQLLIAGCWLYYCSCSKTIALVGDVTNSRQEDLVSTIALAVHVSLDKK